MRIKPIAAAGALVFALSACAASPEPTSNPSTLTPSASTSSASVTTGITVSQDMTAKPEVQFPDGFGNVDNLIVEDIVPGTGAVVQATDNVTVQYVGIGAVSKQQFDASWDAGTTASFPLSGVILGWQQGLLGMHVGGRRLLVIPGALAYGPTPPDGSGIGANETLVFVVDLISIP